MAGVSFFSAFLFLFPYCQLLGEGQLTAKDSGPFPLEEPVLWVLRVIGAGPFDQIRVVDSDRGRLLNNIVSQLQIPLV